MKLKELKPYDYFTDFMVEKTIAERFGSQYPEVLKEKLKEMALYDYFNMDLHKLYGEQFPDVFIEKIKDLSPWSIFMHNYHNKYAEGKMAIPLDILLEKANKLDPEAFFRYNLHKDERFKSITNSIKMNEDITTFEED